MMPKTRQVKKKVTRKNGKIITSVNESKLSPTDGFIFGLRKELSDLNPG